MQKKSLFLCGVVVGLTALSIAFGAVPSKVVPSTVTDDTALYQNLSEIRVKRESAQHYDADINRLASMESRYRENLPTLAESAKLKGAMQRVSQMKYKPSSKRK